MIIECIKLLFHLPKSHNPALHAVQWLIVDITYCKAVNSIFKFLKLNLSLFQQLL